MIFPTHYHNPHLAGGHDKLTHTNDLSLQTMKKQLKGLSGMLMLTWALCLLSRTAYSQTTFIQNGPLDERHITYAITGATIHPESGQVIENGTIIWKDGKIEAIGQALPIPQGAVEISGRGKHIYPSFIDLFSDYGMPEVKKEKDGGAPQYDPSTKGAYAWNDALKTQQSAAALFNADPKKAESLRKMGFGMVASHRRDGISRGSAVLTMTGDEKENLMIVKTEAAGALSFDKGSSGQEYPSSLMGAIALLRQTYLDADWYKSQKEETILPLQEWNRLSSLPQIFEAGDKLNVLRAQKIAAEFKALYIIKSSGNEYQRISEIKSAGCRLIVPLHFPEGWDLSDPYDASNLSLGELRHWESAPGNAAMLATAGIPFCLTQFDLKKKEDFMKNLRKAMRYGLSEDAALKALTETPAEWMGISATAGKLKKGYLSNFIICTHKLSEDNNTILEHIIKGRRYIIQESLPQEANGKYRLSAGKNAKLILEVSGAPGAMKLQVLNDTVKLKTEGSYLAPQSMKLHFESPKGESPDGKYRLSGIYERASLQGTGQDPSGNWFTWKAERISDLTSAAVKDSSPTMTPIPATYFPHMAYGYTNAPAQEDVLIKNITIWTSEEAGVLKEHDLIISKGKFIKVGKSLTAAPGMKVIDGTGKHLTPGMIDEHSHIAVSNEVNEGSYSITSEVRIGDVIDGDDINIYRQLSGGVTTSHLLHGSANSIGGQTALIKLRWGKSPEAMKFEGADGFIKFALGENVKQSNWGERNVSRYPQTRMGVEQTMYDAFIRARAYDARRKVLKPGDIFRRDLKLEALAEILNKKRFITCHSYVQSEINMLIHLADSFHFKVNTFTHILEGYKVADKMKAHGVAGSTFADWWAYKYEVMEAIPHNASLMHRMGILTSVNSDDAEMARRLNQEAAKGIRYGGMSEEDALKMSTINPARMLHIDARTGSIKEGKDADIVIWSDNPLSVYAKVEKTFVDGICYFDLEKDLELRKKNAEDRARLIQLVMKDKSGEKNKPRMSVPRLLHCNDMEKLYHEHLPYEKQ